MSEKKEFLNEERYQQTKKKLSRIILTIFVIGVLIGVSLIAVGLIKKGEINSKFSDANKAKVQEQLSQEKTKLEEKKNELENSKTTSLEIEKTNLIQSKSELEEKIKPVEDEIKSLERVKFTGFDDDYYAREDKIKELKKSIEQDKKTISIIEDALDENFDHCSFDEEKNNSYTSKYCSIKNNKTDELSSISVINKALDSSFNYCQYNEVKNNSLTSKYCSLAIELEKINDGSERSFESSKSIPLFMLGAFIIIASCMICGPLYLGIVKKREIMAYGAQQVMPVAQEGIEKVAPTIGKAGASIAKEMAPVYGEIAKEISRGIKEGKEDKKEEEDKKE